MNSGRTRCVSRASGDESSVPERRIDEEARRDDVDRHEHESRSRPLPSRLAAIAVRSFFAEVDALENVLLRDRAIASVRNA